MQSQESTINAFQRVLSSFTFSEATSFGESFAQQRFIKKFQVPDLSRQTDLANDCWSAWIEEDATFPRIALPSKQWYEVRDFFHRNLGRPNFREVGFPKGSEFHPTRSSNSLEAKLSRSKWSSTYSNFEHFARICYHHKALKRATRRRYQQWYDRQDFKETLSQSNRLLWNRFKEEPKPGFSVFEFKLSCITKFEQGSRFSTVPKNNERRRPINIECFGNIVTQRTVGNWLRNEIYRLYQIDLDHLATQHRLRIQCVDEAATIDLSNASDRVSRELCKFLLPDRVFKILDDLRSPMILGPDRQYHVIQKMSSMGNGYTFELMTLILTALARTLDPKATVFGDDIIIHPTKAESLIKLLEEVGFQVNVDKTFYTGDFRESCGANYHRKEGYIESFDFMYPTSIGDCVLLFNKCFRLRKYPSFKKLYDGLARVLPPALQGGPCSQFENVRTLDLIGKAWDSDDVSLSFPPFFVTRTFPKGSMIEVKGKLSTVLQDLQIPGPYFLVKAWEFKSMEKTQMRRHLNPLKHWAKYEMYLAAGRRTKDTLTDMGDWLEVTYLSTRSQQFRLRSLLT